MANNKEKTQAERRRKVPARGDLNRQKDEAGEMRATPLIGTQAEKDQRTAGRTPPAPRRNTPIRDADRKRATAESGGINEEKGTRRKPARKEKSAANRAEEIARRIRAREAGQKDGGQESRQAAETKDAARKPAARRLAEQEAREPKGNRPGRMAKRAIKGDPAKQTEKSLTKGSRMRRTTERAAADGPKAPAAASDRGGRNGRTRKEKASSQSGVMDAYARGQEPETRDQLHTRLQARRKITPPFSHDEGKPVISQILTLVGKKPATLRSRAGEHVPRETLRVIPLGGMCEIGKNMTAYEYGSDIIIVDCGQVFPDETMPGIDTVIPDFTYVLQNKDRVRGIFITHGHEDHIGGLPFLMQELNAPLYAGRMTVELLKYKLDDRIPGLAKRCSMTVIPDGGIVEAGCFSVEFIHVNHSIADAFMFAIRTPIGVVMHSGDFKIDYTPVDGEIMDLQRIAQLGRQGVLLFLCESTNIEVPGFTRSERHVGETLAEMFEGAQGRIFVATFSSNTSRLQQIFTAAERHGRKVALVGRSMLNVFNAANNLGYIHMKEETLIDISEADNYPPEEVVIISTGSQGEPMSALTRIAFSNHRQVEIRPGDTVIISATPIPGNEKPIYKVINELYRRGCRVYYSALADVHVSGHASREELKLVHELIRPQYFIPAHGETRMLYQHAEMAHRLGTPYENIFILANGDIFEIGKDGAKVTGFTNGDAVLIDGSASGEVDNAVLQERRMLGDDGVLSAALVIRANGELAAAPTVCGMGFLYESEHGKIEAAARQFLMEATERAALNGGVKEAVESGQMAAQLRAFLYSRTKRRPVAMISLIVV